VVSSVAARVDEAKGALRQTKEQFGGKWQVCMQNQPPEMPVRDGIFLMRATTRKFIQEFIGESGPSIQLTRAVRDKIQRQAETNLRERGNTGLTLTQDALNGTSSLLKGFKTRKTL
jgi:hypothetical protein